MMFLSFVSEVTRAKIVLITADDMYSLKQFSLSPLYWINRVLLRKKIRKSISKASVCYSMSDVQVKELSREFGGKFKILRKGSDLVNTSDENECEIKSTNENCEIRIYWKLDVGEMENADFNW